MKIATLRRNTKETLDNILLDESDVITDILISNIFGVSRSELYNILDMEAPKEADAIINECIARLSEGVPIQYIIGSCYFYGLEIMVGPGCFIPRSDTELAVKAALGVLPNGGKFVDICAGSGCISAAIAENKKDSFGYALELSYKALDFTEKNLEKYPNVSIRRFDALDEDDYTALAEVETGKFDVLVSNPPYIPTDDIELLSTQVRYEPETALDGGEDGLRFYREILRYSPIIMKPLHAIVFEVGINQADIVAEMMRALGYAVAVIKDLGGIDRIILGKKY